MDAQDLGRGLLYLGLLLVLVGGIVLIGHRFLDFGHLPGDIRYESENVRVYVPLGTMVVVSVVLTLLINLLLRLWR